ncbi:MAG: alpha/beta fold hydrolase [bacterium]
MDRIRVARSRALRALLNGFPARWIHLTYDLYSKIYQGQLRLGLPVSRKLLKTEGEMRARATGKLALALYHIFYHATGSRIPRPEIKRVLMDELDRKWLRLTEDVILLSKDQLTHLAEERFHIGRRFLPDILAEAGRRRILKETLRQYNVPAYFESEIEEREQNGRGDYELVHYRDFTEEGKAIGFRRLASMEGVTAGDSRPSVVLVPGIGCNSNCFDLSNRYSLAKDLSDLGCWVYLFDPRGMGVNQGKFDPLCTVDTLIDYDLATASRFIYRRSKGKPMILVGHSMGGMICEAMVLTWSLRRHLHRLDVFSSEQREQLDKILPPLQEAEESLSMIRGIISLGSPKSFQKWSHVLFPATLWLNHLSRIFRLRYVPFRETIWFLTRLPGVRLGTEALMNTNVANLNFLINPENHKADRKFVTRFLQECGESFPLGLGFQFLKAIYNGEGFKRMDATRLNYSELLSLFPENLPIFHFWGTEDPLAPLGNLSYSRNYPHQVKKVYRLARPQDLAGVEITTERSQLVDFVVEGANHLDLLYGKSAEQIIQPLLVRAVREVWAGWMYSGKQIAA